VQSFLFVFRQFLAWTLAWAFVMAIWAIAIGRVRWFIVVGGLVVLVVVTVRAISHVHRVRFVTDAVQPGMFANRHRRRIEIPFPAARALDIVDATIRELPRAKHVQTVRDSLQVRARVARLSPYFWGGKPEEGEECGHDSVSATVSPGEASASVTLVCEPEFGAWGDWFVTDGGANLENAEAITRAISRRIAEARALEQENVRQTETEKELTAAKLSLLHAQVEPHFLYNTLASAQLLARNDPPKADQMLGNLISYLRRSLPRAEEELSTVGDEVERTRAYLEIMKIRMGDRLAVQVEVPEAFRIVPMPPMMLQTLVENAIKHGLEPLPGGGTIWVIARESEGRLLVTVADDGRGFSAEGGGSGVGLKNVRERLRLAFGDKASFSIVANYPKGVAATIALPLS